MSREMYRIGREAISNAFLTRARGQDRSRISYGHAVVTLTVRDNGIGIEPQVLDTGRIGHWGFPYGASAPKASARKSAYGAVWVPVPRLF